jgi:hypothetical protein
VWFRALMTPYVRKATAFRVAGGLLCKKGGKERCNSTAPEAILHLQ